jgi:signal transduction histidine kinase
MYSLAEAKNVAIQVRANESLIVRADGEKLLRVLFNLVDNALKFSPVGSRVTLTASREDDRVALAVADMGVGMSPEHLPHIFERFFRVDEAHSPHIEGTGLGLAIADSLVAAQGGAIEVESVLGCGTTFIVKMPSQGKG